METVTLDHPFKRGEQEITTVTLLEPTGTGWLRGLKLIDLASLDANALTTALPRITEPALTEQEIRASLHPADLLQLGAKVVDFLSPKSAREDASPPA
ncbi:MAG: phage tail assembly protein [Azoarcus sp.]|jgi:hypothetical protein|nr:phage tail assembly protein [Azoarcus sp.]